VLFIQNGDPAMVKVVNITTARRRKEFPLPVRNPKSVHGQFRHARLTSAGTLMVAHMDLAKVAEYDPEGKEIWSIPAEGGAWGITPLANGNFLIVDRSGVREVNRARESVWAWARTDLPDYRIANLQLAWRLPNGNTLINNWANQWKGRSTRPPLRCRRSSSRRRKRSSGRCDRGLTRTLVPRPPSRSLTDSDAPENVAFGDIK